MISPSGKQLFDVEFSLDLTAHERRRAFLTLSSLPFSEPGRCEFVVEIQDGDDWNEVDKLPLDVDLQIEDDPATKPAHQGS